MRRMGGRWASLLIHQIIKIWFHCAIAVVGRHESHTTETSYMHCLSNFVQAILKITHMGENQPLVSMIFEKR